jgi:hypothetical protein
MSLSEDTAGVADGKRLVLTSLRLCDSGNHSIHGQTASPILRRQFSISVFGLLFFLFLFYLNPKMHFIFNSCRHVGSKSSPAAPLQAVMYPAHLRVFIPDD